MVIATRNLTLKRDDVDHPVQVRLFAPEQDGASWVCRYEIDWPDVVRKSFAAGVDSVQALHLALQKVGIDVYMSRHHASGGLVWIDPDDGYGFPVPKNGRDLLIGSDRIFEG